MKQVRASPQCAMRDMKDPQASDTRMGGTLFSVAIDEGSYWGVIPESRLLYYIILVVNLV